MINPITLNHYVYANANPNMFVDPSGNMSIMSVTHAMITYSRFIVSRLITFTKKRINRRHFGRPWTVYKVKSRIGRSPFHHSYIYLKAQQPISGTLGLLGYRYDIMDTEQGVVRAALRNWPKTVAGTLKRRDVKHRRQVDGTIKKVVELTPFQMLVWQASVLHGETIDGQCDIRYGFTGSGGVTCTRWTKRAAIKAKRISKLPFGG